MRNTIASDGRIRTPSSGRGRLDNLLFGTMQALFGAGFGVLFVFIVGYMEGYGYSGVEIGYVRAVGAGASVVGSLLWGAVADKSQRIGLVIGVITVAGVVLAPLFSMNDGAFWPLMILFALASFFLIPIQILVDSWTTAVAQHNSSVSYGATRAMGSLGFAIALLFAGRAFDTFGIEYIFPIYALLLLPLLPCVLVGRRRYGSGGRRRADGTAAASVAADGASAADGAAAAASAAATAGAGGVQQPARSSGIIRAQTRRRMLNRPLIAFFGVFSVIMACFIASLNFMPLLMSELGGSHRHVGSASAVMALSEVPFMIFSAVLLRRFRDSKVIGVACLFFALRVGSHLVFRTPEGLVAGHALQGLSFGLFMPAAVALCTRITRPSHRTRVLALLNIVIFGVGDVISGIVGGWLIDLYGVRGMYAVISIVIWIPVAWYCWRFVLRRR